MIVRFLLTGSRRGEESRDASTRGPDALGQGTLRTQFDANLTGEVLLLENLVVT